MSTSKTNEPKAPTLLALGLFPMSVADLEVPDRMP